MGVWVHIADKYLYLCLSFFTAKGKKNREQKLESISSVTACVIKDDRLPLSVNLFWEKEYQKGVIYTFLLTKYI